MKTTLIASLLACIAFTACTTTGNFAPPPPRNTLSSFDVPHGSNAVRNIPKGTIRWQETDITQVLDFYQELSQRTVIRSPQVTANIKISFHNEQPLNRIETLRLLDTVLAQQGVAMIYQGDDMVKAVPAGAAPTEAAPEINLPAELLPQSSSMMQRTVKLKHITGDHAQGIIAPFTKLPNSVIAIKGSRTLILRDYAANIRKMLSILEQVDTAEQARARTEAWPIRPARTVSPAAKPK